MDIVKQLKDIFVSYGENALEVLPSLLIAILVLVLFWVLAKVARKASRSVSGRLTDDESLQSLFATVSGVLTIAVGVFAAAAVVFPGLKAGDLMGVLGLSSVAIGFAFKDIFQNFLAGIIILAKRPFTIGDQIVADGMEGIVEEIHIRSTNIRTSDGQRIIIPNSHLYTNPITVRTAFKVRRTSFGTGIGYGEDIDKGREVIYEALKQCDLVESDPAPQVFVNAHGDSAVSFSVRYWTKPDQGTVTRALDEVATAVKYALDEADVEIPYPHRTIEFFDMTKQEQHKEAA